MTGVVVAMPRFALNPLVAVREQLTTNSIPRRNVRYLTVALRNVRVV